MGGMNSRPASFGVFRDREVKIDLSRYFTVKSKCALHRSPELLKTARGRREDEPGRYGCTLCWLRALAHRETRQ